ncbi:O-antigen ligase family protein [Thiohalomonas denitrificans]|uniref:Probable O-glycosylation ligase, exosortase A-associated n=1 Tax=Thiohalomonas denitrificans TaxID=415747 RepID=A0A1G5Q2M1_9GAMM|nr:O-antigen ligase family protein [Thiohalomonas denitrificans]SCZ55917.1 probable O-glycosylation ligase, exosortase A-associated [Thiohalomonas denitrificans]
MFRSNLPILTSTIHVSGQFMNNTEDTLALPGEESTWRRTQGIRRLPKRSTAGFILAMAFLFLEYVRPQDYVAALGIIRPGLILAVLLFSLWLTKSEKGYLKTPLVRVYLAFIALIVISVFYAVNNHAAFVTTKGMLITLLAGVLPLMAFVDSHERLKKFIRLWLLFHVVAAVLGILNGGKGPGSFLGDENDLALALNIAIPYAFFMSKSPGNSRKERLLYLGATVALVLGVIATMSRGGFVGLLIVTCGVIVFSENRLRNSLLLGFVGLIALLFASEQYVEEMKTITDPTESTAQKRFYYWGRAWEMFVDNPVLGVGANNFPYQIYEYEIRDPEYDIRHNKVSWGRVAHSAYFSLIAELGLTGTILFGLIIVRLSRMLRSIPRFYATLRPDKIEARHSEVILLSRAALVGLFGYLATGAFLSVLYYPHVWYLIAVAVILERLVARHREQLRGEGALYSPGNRAGSVMGVK